MTAHTAASTRARRPSQTPALISVVIPALNAAGTLSAQLEALASQRYDGAWEVVVVDNGSTDGTAAVARGWAGRLPELVVVPATHRKGINYARNAGVAASRGDFLAFCDADDRVASGWLSGIVEAARHYDMVGGALDDASLNDAVTRAWRPPWAPCDRLPIALDFLPYAVSASCGIWALVLRAVGGWNEDYERGCTDMELSWRVQVAGYHLGFAPRALVHYRLRQSLAGVAYQFYRYGRSEPQLYSAFARSGMPRSSWHACRAWGWIVFHTPDMLLGRRRRGFWVRTLAYRVGRVGGSVRNRVVYL